MSSDQQWDIVSGVGVTALAVAAGRAIESTRPDALITDPYAPAFLAAASSAAPFPTTLDQLEERAGASGLWPLMTAYLGIRSRVFDDFLTGAARDGVRQVVILASGLDTRPFRLEWPAGVRCFELDQPLVLDFKLAVLAEHGAAASCAHTPVRADLREDWAFALEEAGFDAALPTAWLAEGLLPYLPPEAEERLFKEIDRLSASGSSLAIEDVSAVEELAGDTLVRDGGTALGIDLPSLLPDGAKRGPREQLDSLGWRYDERSVLESARRLGRPMESAPRLMEHMFHAFARRP
ncbi:SAM-dependent methyltransferase [Streptomyces diacarni]|uniref:S-adenosyl-L-methionine-dependent methyltransferase n=1 Tax=Streptomyces diacarni TaxID=2800381 RepID=A0A367FA45_9ACTN|nr:SAM-dependent methyltransferase [Streptomyces diacarni]RCG27141.1 SAM-dependent methyltransferase [Streptomyces diacarni]